MGWKGKVASIKSCDASEHPENLHKNARSTNLWYGTINQLYWSTYFLHGELNNRIIDIQAEAGDDPYL